jgi:hypothetical protein
MPTMPVRFTVSIVFAAQLAACTTPTRENPVAAPGAPLRVIYATHKPDGSYLKKTPVEVDIVTRETTGKAVASQVFLNVALLALVGGVGFQTFSKDDLRGASIDDALNREHLRNPIPVDFVARMQKSIDAAMQTDPTLGTKGFDKPVVVSSGHVSLVYEDLAGNDEPLYRLKTDLQVYKHKETWSLLNGAPYVVDCSHASKEPLPRSRWAQNDYVLIAQSLASALSSCESKVIAQLPALLKD